MVIYAFCVVRLVRHHKFNGRSEKALQRCEIVQPRTTIVFITILSDYEAHQSSAFIDMSLNTFASNTVVTLAFHGSC
jgi:hypothetical protein